MVLLNSFENNKFKNPHFYRKKIKKKNRKKKIKQFNPHIQSMCLQLIYTHKHTHICVRVKFMSKLRGYIHSITEGTSHNKSRE